MPDGNTIGTNCNVTLRHALVNSNVAQGFYVKDGSYREILPKVYYVGTQSGALYPVGDALAVGKRLIEMIIVCEDGMVHIDGSPSESSGAEWYTRLADYLVRVGSAHTITNPAGVARAVWIDSYEERFVPLAGQPETASVRREVKILWIEA